MNATLAAVPSTETPLDFMARTTPQLRAAVSRQQAVMPPAEFAEMMAGIRGIFEKYTAKLLEFKPGVERATALHRMMDRELKATEQLSLSCRKGCGGCCHYEVEITEDEAALLKNTVLGGVVIDHDRLAVQAARERKSTEWNRFGSRDNRCVFLGDDGACRIYEDRPSICRKHMVTTPASACTTEGAAVAPVQVLLAEILLSADLSIAGTAFGSLAKMLQKALHDASTRRNAVPGAPSKISIRAAAGQRAAAQPAEPANPVGRAFGEIPALAPI